MTTSLFPANVITIQQGNTGDCYFLSTLDCIFNSGPEGLAKVRSLFTETADGVTVRIKRSSISSYLRPEKIKGKYDYLYDINKNEDVFVISKKRLEEIDGHPAGVKTNSLAVKILEHLSSYYYVEKWEPNGDIMDSVIAHNVSKRHEGTSTEFMGYLLGIQTEDLSDIDEIIKLKTLDPSYPVYISMSYGKKDAHGHFHGRHALRLEKVVANPLSPGGYDFVLVNPWNNQTREQYSLNDIKERKSRYCLFDIKPETTGLIKMILGIPLEDAQFILKTPILSALIMELQSLCRWFDSDDAEHCLALYKNIPTLGLIYKGLLKEEKTGFLNNINAANGNIDEFLSAMLTGTKRIELVNLILSYARTGIKSTPIAVDFCLSSKNDGLFRLLNHVDFLAQINNSRLDKNLFLTHLIELIAEQPGDNFVQLKAIAAYIKQYNAAHLANPLTVNFTEKTIFDLALNKAINEKAVLLKGDKDAAKKLVGEGLIQYYFTDQFNCITSSGGLRSLFQKYSCSKEFIERNDAPQWTILSTIRLLNAQENPAVITELLKKRHHLTKKHLDHILKEVKVVDPRTLFTRLYELNKLNPQLAIHLYHQVIEQFKQKFHIEFPNFVMQVRHDKADDFLQWFLANLPEGSKQVIKDQAQFIIAGYIEKIQNFSVSVQSIQSPELLNQHVRALKIELNVMATEPALIEAQKQLDVPERNQTILAVKYATDEKIKAIDAMAADHTSFLHTRAAIITDAVKSVKAFSYTFTNVYQSSDIKIIRDKYVQNLRDSLTTNKKLSQALTTVSPYPVLLSDALKAKSEEIEGAATTQYAILIEAEQTIKEKIDFILSLLSSFAHISSELIINDQTTIQLEQLYQHLNDPKVLRAQSIVGFKNQSHPELNRIIEQQAQVIIRNAEAQLAVITEQNNCIARIKAFTVLFSNLDSTQRVQERAKVFLVQLDQLVARYHGALPHPVQVALNEKRRVIHDAARKQDELILNAEKIVTDYLYRITHFDITFQPVMFPQELTTISAAQVEQLRVLANETTLSRALLVIPTANRRVQEAVLAKEKAIQTKVADVRTSLLQAAETTINESIKSIKSFNYTFARVYKTSDIQTIKEGYIRDLHDTVLTSNALVQAIETLKLTQYPTRLSEALKSKAEEIAHDAEAHTATLLDAQNTFDRWVKQIKELPISFAGLNSRQMVEASKGLLCSQVAQLIDNSQVSEAVQMLKLQEAMKETLEKKYKAINEAAMVQDQFILDAETNIASYLHRISNFGTTFQTQMPNETIDESTTMIANLRALSHETTLRDALLIMPSANQRIQNALLAKQNSIWNEAAQIILNQSGFLAHLDIILDKTLELEKHHANDRAASAARTLYEKLESAKQNLLTQPAAIQVKLATFKDDTSHAIKDARPILKNHRGWKQVFADILSAVLTVASLFITYFSTSRFRLFNMKTDSEQKLWDLEQNIQQIPGAIKLT